MPGDFFALPTHCPRVVHHWAGVCLVAACLVTVTALAADAALSWDSLSGEQQYMLARLRPRWETLDVAGRRQLLERAADFKLRRAARSPVPTAAAQPTTKEPAPARQQRAQRRGMLTLAEAGLSAHSFRLRRVLRDIPGLGATERRDVLERWGELSNSERIALVDNYARNVDDDEEIALRKALRDGKITTEELQRGLATGKLQGADLKAALASGRLSTAAVVEGLASNKIFAEDLEKILRHGNVESADLRNAIEHSRLPEGVTRESVAPVESVTPTEPVAAPP